MKKQYQELAFILSAVICWLGLSVYAAFAQPSGVAQNVQISSQVVMGLQGIYPDILLQYQEPTTTTAQFAGSTTVVIPANTTGNVVSCATLFPAFASPVCIGLQDVTNPGQQVNVGTSTDDGRINMAASGFFVYRVADGLPTFYIDNPGDSDAAIRVFGLSN